jgi:hypothetical protein
MSKYDSQSEDEIDDEIKKLRTQKHKWDGYQPVYEDTGETCDESFDPKYIKEILKTYNGEEFSLRDSKRNEYSIINGRAVMVRKFISWEEGYEICCGDEFVECDSDDC